jgi:hypothetical protein
MELGLIAMAQTLYLLMGIQVQVKQSLAAKYW